jgi:CRP-like cAMP-binding protein
MCLSEVTSRLKRVTARTGQYIITAGEEGKNMYFIGSTPQNTIGSGLKLGEELARGIVHNKCLRVVVDGVEVTLLGTGDYFGEVYRCLWIRVVAALYWFLCVRNRGWDSNSRALTTIRATQVALMSKTDHRRTADVTAICPCELYELSKEDVYAVTKKFPILQVYSRQEPFMCVNVCKHACCLSAGTCVCICVCI